MLSVTASLQSCEADLGTVSNQNELQRSDRLQVKKIVSKNTAAIGYGSIP